MISLWNQRQHQRTVDEVDRYEEKAKAEDKDENDLADILRSMPAIGRGLGPLRPWPWMYAASDRFRFSMGVF